MIVDPLRGARQVLCQAWIQSIVYYFNCRQKLSSSLGVQTEHNYNMDVTVTMPAYYSLLQAFLCSLCQAGSSLCRKNTGEIGGPKKEKRKACPTESYGPLLT